MIRKQLSKHNAKQHYRLYKSGKQWVTALVTVVSVGTGALFVTQSQVHADTTSNTQNATNSSATSNSITTTSSVANPTVTTSYTTNGSSSTSNVTSTNTSFTNVSSNATLTSDTTPTSNTSVNVSNIQNSTTPTSNNIISTTTTSVSTNELDTSSLNTDYNQMTTADNTVALDASMLRDGDTSDSIAAGTWGTASWNLANDGTLTLENGDLQTPAHPQALNNVANQVTHIKTINVKAPVFSGGLFAANKNGDFNGTFGNYATNSHPVGDGFINVQSIDVSGLDTSETTNMNRMFDTDDKLTTIYGLNTMNTSNVKDARFMFVGAHVQYLDLSNFNMKALTSAEKPLVSIIDANGNVTYTEDSPGMYGWDPQVGMFAGAKFGSVKTGVNNNIQNADFYTNGGDHLVDQNGNQITNNEQLLALANSSNPTTYSTSVHDSLSGLISNIQNLQSSFANRYSNGDGIASGASTAASMAETAVGIDPTTYSSQVSMFDSVATLQTLLAQSPMYRNVHVDMGNNDHDNEINSGVAYLQNSGANNLASLAQVQYAQYKSATITGISSADSVIDSISTQAIAYNSQAFTVANDTDKMANNFRFINEINKEKAVASTLQSDGNNYLSQAQATLANGKALVDTSASASISASQSASADKQSALNSAQTSANNALSSAQTSAQNALTSLQSSATSTNNSLSDSATNQANSLQNSANSQANSLSNSAANQVTSQSVSDSQSADSRVNSITQSIQNSAANHIASQSTTDSNSADSRANSIVQSLQSSANSQLASQSTTDSSSADSRANSLNNSANSHIASQSTTDSNSADSRANSLSSSASSHVASQSTTDSQSADSRANSVTQSLQASAASHIASQVTIDSQSAESMYSNLINSATIALNGLTSSANSTQTSMSNSAASQHVYDSSSANEALLNQKSKDDNEYQKLYHKLIDEQFKVANLKAAQKEIKQGHHPLIKINQTTKLISSNGVKRLLVKQNPILELTHVRELKHNKVLLHVKYQQQNYQIKTTKSGFAYAYYNRNTISKQNPVKLMTLQSLKAYRHVKFNNPVKRYAPNTQLTAVKMVNNNGVARFQLSNGHYVTANKYFIAIK